jgi:seryl-tRNA synthetase
MEMLDLIHEGKPWAKHQHMTDVVLAPAACYPIYPMVSGTLPDGGRLFDVFSYCFRHEPSSDPARMQMFRMRELVRVTDADKAIAFRDMWLERGLTLLKSLALPVASDVAADIFFGRGGKVLAMAQRDLKLKYEIQMPICSTEAPTAIFSTNCHQDHFGKLFNIKTASGQTAHTACVGFGMERITLGLFKTHGFSTGSWPKSVRELLWP